VTSHARAQAPDWSALAGEDVIEVLTHDADGELRETKVWLAVVDGHGYVRTGDTRWRANLDREPDTVIRIAGREYPLRAEHVTDAELIKRINETFRAKYGFSDRFLGWFSNEARTSWIWWRGRWHLSGRRLAARARTLPVLARADVLVGGGGRRGRGDRSPRGGARVVSRRPRARSAGSRPTV
jgi:hypothetical protein